MPIDKKELLAALKDPAVLNFVRSQVIQNSTTTGIGRYPGLGAPQNDVWPYRDAADGTFPWRADYVMPKNFQRLISARLSFIIRAYRTYSSLTLSSTGATTPAADATGESGHSHSHNHGTHNHGFLPESNTTGSGSVTWDTTNQKIATSASGISADSTVVQATTPNTDATGSSGHSHSHTHGSHTHTVSGTTTLGIAEDVAPNNPGLTISFDGVDKTAALGGPFQQNMIEIDVTQFLQTTPGVQHTVALQPNQRVTITGILRISYNVDNRVAQ